MNSQTQTLPNNNQHNTVSNELKLDAVPKYTASTPWYLQKNLNNDKGSGLSQTSASMMQAFYAKSSLQGDANNPQNTSKPPVVDQIYKVTGSSGAVSDNSNYMSVQQMFGTTGQGSVPENNPLALIKKKVGLQLNQHVVSYLTNDLNLMPPADDVVNKEEPPEKDEVIKSEENGTEQED